MSAHVLAGNIPEFMTKVIVGVGHILNNQNPLPGLKPNLPPYNIEVLEANSYRITVSIPGFEKKDVDVRVEEAILTVSGKGRQTKESSLLTHRGIFDADFKLVLPLAPHVKVNSVTLKNGLLIIELNREIPDELKEKVFEIN